MWHKGAYYNEPRNEGTKLAANLQHAENANELMKASGSPWCAAIQDVNQFFNYLLAGKRTVKSCLHHLASLAFCHKKQKKDKPVQNEGCSIHIRKEVSCPVEYNVGRDVVHELGSRAGFPTKRSLHHHERFAAELKAAEFAEKKCCAQAAMKPSVILQTFHQKGSPEQELKVRVTSTESSFDFDPSFRQSVSFLNDGQLKTNPQIRINKSGQWMSWWRDEAMENEQQAGKQHLGTMSGSNSSEVSGLKRNTEKILQRETIPSDVLTHLIFTVLILVTQVWKPMNALKGEHVEANKFSWGQTDTLLVTVHYCSGVCRYGQSSRVPLVNEWGAAPLQSIVVKLFGAGPTDTRVIAYETNCSKLELFFQEEFSHSKCTEICSTVGEVIRLFICRQAVGNLATHLLPRVMVKMLKGRSLWRSTTIPSQLIQLCKSSCHSVVLAPFPGDLAGKTPSRNYELPQHQISASERPLHDYLFSTWAKQKLTVTCRKEKDKRDTELDCESTNRQEVLLKVTSREHLNPPLAPETQTGALQASRNYLPRGLYITELMTALPGETGVKGTGEVGDPGCATNPELLNPGLGFAECVRDLEALVALGSHNTRRVLNREGPPCIPIMLTTCYLSIPSNASATFITAGICQQKQETQTSVSVAFQVFTGLNITLTVYYLLEKKRMPPVEVHIGGTSSVASALYAMGKVFLSEMENDAEHAEPANGCDAELLGGCNY
ncbi:hypothetical protein Q9966_008691 [Columba livia]|nr:hypothetical protein Q9966_008691 [Columba livia]